MYLVLNIRLRNVACKQTIKMKRVFESTNFTFGINNNYDVVCTCASLWFPNDVWTTQQLRYQSCQLQLFIAYLSDQKMQIVDKDHNLRQVLVPLLSQIAFSAKNWLRWYNYQSSLSITISMEGSHKPGFWDTPSTRINGQKQRFLSRFLLIQW